MFRFDPRKRPRARTVHHRQQKRRRRTTRNSLRSETRYSRLQRAVRQPTPRDRYELFCIRTRQPTPRRTATTPPNHRRELYELSSSYHRRRSCIRKYYVDGLSHRSADGRNVSTVSREIRRNKRDIPTLLNSAEAPRHRSTGCDYIEESCCGDLVAGAGNPCELNFLPVISLPQGKEPRSERNAREIQ